jgi:predicted DNA-binding transcriptional regulator YafY
MKEFNKTNKVTYNLISYTGFKSLLLFSFLQEGPKTYEQIQEFYRENEYIHENLSQDTIRVYMTSLKRIGCEIKRVKINGSSQYEIVSHPFEFTIPDNQIKAISKTYRILTQIASVSDIFALENFLRDLATKINSTELMNTINKISMFGKINVELVRELDRLTKQNNKIVILYNSPKSGVKEIEIIPKSLAFVQNTLYLNGISLEYNQEASYLIKRIKKIVDVVENPIVEPDIKFTTVGYELSTKVTGFRLSDNEKIVEINENSVLVEANTSNLFMLKRKILEYGAFCTVLYPEDFRQDIISTLKNMQEEYQND